MVSFSIIATLAMALAATAAPAPSPAPLVDGQASANLVGSVKYYEPSVGFCGKHSSASDFVVSMSQSYVGPKARMPSCGRRVHIVAGDKSIDATVVDACTDCGVADIEVSPAAFKALYGDLSVGQGFASWGFLQD